MNRETQMPTTTPCWNKIKLHCCLALTLIAATFTAACHKAKNYTWQQVLPTVTCEPRTPQAKAQLGSCPKVADPQHPTPEEAQEYVDYMNKRDALEGTVGPQGFQGPGCLKWRIDPTSGQPTFDRTTKKEGCSNLNHLQNYKLP
jgi:hypothetical protein